MSKLSDSIKVYLSTSVALYVKSNAFHWNVVDPRFGQLHCLFGEVYTSTYDTIDDTAEIIRQLNEFPPSSMKQFLELSRITEQPRVPKADIMIKELLADMDIIIQLALETFDLATEAREQSIANYMADRQAQYEKLRWKLRSTTAL